MVCHRLSPPPPRVARSGVARNFHMLSIQFNSIQFQSQSRSTRCISFPSPANLFPIVPPLPYPTTLLFLLQGSVRDRPGQGRGGGGSCGGQAHRENWPLFFFFSHVTETMASVETASTSGHQDGNHQPTLIPARVVSPFSPSLYTSR